MNLLGYLNEKKKKINQKNDTNIYGIFLQNSMNSDYRGQHVFTNEMKMREKKMAEKLDTIMHQL